VIQGESEDELPEVLLAGASTKYIDCSAVDTLEPMMMMTAAAAAVSP